MKRNSNTLFLISPNATTPIPWVNNEPDFSSFSEPTLSVLQLAWSDFLASGEALEIIPDPEPIVPLPDPRWTDFNKAMLGNSYWQSWAIPPDLRMAIIAAAIVANPTPFQDAYDIGKTLVPPTVEAIASWQPLADQFDIPVVF